MEPEEIFTITHYCVLFFFFLFTTLKRPQQIGQAPFFSPLFAAKQKSSKQRNKEK